MLLFTSFTHLCLSVDNVFDGSTDNNWSVPANWSQNTVPTATDGYVTRFDATSPNCTVNGTGRTCNALDFTGYTNTITMSYYISSYGAITFSPTMNVSGTGVLVISGSFTLTSNGYMWPNGISTGAATASRIITLADNAAISGTLTVQQTTGTFTINGAFTLSVGGDIPCAITTGNVAGTATIVMSGTGTISTNSATTGQIKNNLVFNTGAGTITFGTVLSYGGGGIMTNTAGTIVTTGSTFNIGNCTLNLADLQLNNVAINVADAVVTLSSGFKVAGLFSNNDVTGAHQSVVSSVGGTLRKITMLAGSTQSITNLDATDIDSRDGYPVIDLGGVLSNTFNWYTRSLNSDFLLMFE